jgi:hypothetical protein
MVLNQIGNRVCTLIVIVGSRTAGMQLENSNKNHSLTRFRRSNSKITSSLSTNNRVPLFVRLLKFERLAVIKYISFYCLTSTVDRVKLITLLHFRCFDAESFL